MIFRNSYIEKIKPFIDKPQVKVLTGIRRGGKSTVLAMLKDELLSQNIAEEQIIMLNFESFSTEELTKPAKLYEFLQQKITSNRRFYLLFDEIQEVENWEKIINSALVDFDCDIYITGSNRLFCAILFSGTIFAILNFWNVL